MGVNSAPGGATSSLGNVPVAESGKGTADKAMKNGHDKENSSANGSVARLGNDGECNSSLTSANTIEIGANINVRINTIPLSNVFIAV